MLSHSLSVYNKALPYFPKFSDRQAWPNSLDPDQMLQNAASDQGLHCLLLIQQFFGTTDSKMDLFKFLDKYGKV